MGKIKSVPTNDSDVTEHNLQVKHGIYLQRYVRIPAIVMADKKLSLSAKTVLAVVTDFAMEQGKGKIFPSYKVLLKRCGCSRATLSKYLHELRDKGYLTWVRTNSVPPRNNYTLTLPFVTNERFNLDEWKLSAGVINRMRMDIEESPIVQQDYTIDSSTRLDYYQSNKTELLDDSEKANESIVSEGENPVPIYTDSSYTNINQSPGSSENSLDNNKDDDDNVNSKEVLQQSPIVESLEDGSSGKEYFLSIEQHLDRNNIHILLVGLNFAPVKKMYEAGVPLELVLRTIDEVKANAKNKTIRSFKYFESAIWENFNRRKMNSGGSEVSRTKVLLARLSKERQPGTSKQPKPLTFDEAVHAMKEKSKKEGH